MRPKLETRSDDEAAGTVCFAWSVGALLVGAVLVAALLAQALVASASPFVDANLSAERTAGSLQAPDSGTVAKLAQQVRPLGRVQVIRADDTPIYVHRPSVVAEGLRYRAMMALEGFSYRRVVRERGDPELLPWSEIRSIRIGGGNAAVGGVLGLAAGVGIGIAVAKGQPCHDEPLAILVGSCAMRELFTVFGCAVAGTLAGAIIGSHVDPERRIYP